MLICIEHAAFSTYSQLQYVFCKPLNFEGKQLNPLLFCSYREIYSLFENPYLKSIVTHNYDKGMDCVIESIFKQAQKPVYGLEGYMTDFTEASFQGPLQKLIRFVADKFEQDSESIFIQLSNMENIKELVENESKSSIEIKANVSNSFSMDWFNRDEDLVFRNDNWLPRLPALVQLHPGKTPLIYVGRAHTMDFLLKIQTQKVLGTVLSIYRYFEDDIQSNFWIPFDWKNVYDEDRNYEGNWMP